MSWVDDFGREGPKLQSKRGPRGRENIEFSGREQRRKKDKVG